MLSDAVDEDDTATQTDGEPRSHGASAHEMHHRYFGRDVIGLLHLDLFRARDLVFVVALTYATLAVAFPVTSPKWQIVFASVNALAWRIFHSLVLGCVLRWQSDSKWFVRHFLKHTAYDSNDGPVRSAFDSWKFLYNTSSVMVHSACSDPTDALIGSASFAALAWRCFLASDRWTLGNEILRYVFGLVRRRRAGQSDAAVSHRTAHLDGHLDLRGPRRARMVLRGLCARVTARQG